MLQPKRTKYRKFQKGRVKGILSNTTQLEFGQFGLKALESGRLPAAAAAVASRHSCCCCCCCTALLLLRC